MSLKGGTQMLDLLPGHRQPGSRPVPAVALQMLGAQFHDLLRERSERVPAEGVDFRCIPIAEDTDGELMLETSDAEATRAAFDAAGIRYQGHEAEDGSDPGLISFPGGHRPEGRPVAHDLHRGDAVEEH